MLNNIYVIFGTFILVLNRFHGCVVARGFIKFEREPKIIDVVYMYFGELCTCLRDVIITGVNGVLTNC